MKENTYQEYNNYKIYLNNWEEYCVCDLHGNLIEWNSSFRTLKEAKDYIDKILN